MVGLTLAILSRRDEGHCGGCAPDVEVDSRTLGPGKIFSVITVISKILVYVKSVASEEINRTRLSNVDDNDIHWVLTVPAIWTDVAKVKNISVC